LGKKEEIKDPKKGNSKGLDSTRYGAGQKSGHTDQEPSRPISKKPKGNRQKGPR